MGGLLDPELDPELAPTDPLSRRRPEAAPPRATCPPTEESQVTELRPHRSDKLPTMSVQVLFDILLVVVALLVVWFSLFTVMRLFKGQN